MSLLTFIQYLEKHIENNKDTKFITVWPVGVNAGDWIKYAYSYRESPETPYTEWVKVEFLSVEGTTVTMCGTIHLSDGTEQNETFTVDVTYDYAWIQAPGFDTLSGFVMLANSTAGDVAYIGYTDGKPCARISTEHGQCFGSVIEGETERTYLGTFRTVVYAEYSTYQIDYGPLTCYWDKQTGVLVEAYTTRSDGWTAKATETNMWESVPSPFGMQWWFFAIVSVGIVALVGAVYFLKKRKPQTTTPLPPEGTDTVSVADE